MKWYLILFTEDRLVREEDEDCLLDIIGKSILQSGKWTYGIIPDEIVLQIFALGGGDESLFGSYYLYLTGAYSIIAVILVMLNLVHIGLFIALGVKALNEKTIRIPIVEHFIDAYIDK